MHPLFYKELDVRTQESFPKLKAKINKMKEQVMNEQKNLPIKDTLTVNELGSELESFLH